MPPALNLALLTFFSYRNSTTNHHASLLQENLKVKDEYARFHGARHVVLPYSSQLDAFKRRNIDVCPGIGEKSGNYQKLAGALWALDNMPGFDWFLISDSDAFFTNWTIDPHQLPLEHHHDPTTHFLGSAHVYPTRRYSQDFRLCASFHTKHKGFYYLNSGVHYMRNSPTSRRILRNALCFSKTNATMLKVERLPCTLSLNPCHACA